MDSRNQIIGLNWLRFIASIYIVLFHTLPRYTVVKQHAIISMLLDLGNFATSAFFVLSGFLLSHIYIKIDTNKNLNSRKFIIGRFSTIYPLHLFSLVLAIPSMLALVVANGGVAYTEIPPGNLVHVLSWREAGLSLLSTLMLTHAWNPWYIPFNAPSWSLSALLFFYFVFLLVAPRIKSITKPVHILIVLAVLFSIPGILADCMNTNSQTVEGILHRNPLIRLPLFLGGMVLSLIYNRTNAQSDQGERKPVLALWFVILGTLIATICIQLKMGERRLHFIQNGFYFPAALALVWLAALKKTSTSEFIKKWSSRLGKTALPLFLLHFPLFDLFSRTERVVLSFLNRGNGELNLHSLITSAKSAEQILLLYPIFFVALLWAAVLVQERFVEPMQSRIRNRFAES